MHAAATFSVTSFEPTELTPSPGIETALPIGVMRMEKSYEGAVAGRSATLFTAAYDSESGRGTYIAMEAFEGSVDGRSGTFAYVHSATTAGTDRTDEYFLIVPGSGTAGLAGIHGSGALVIEADGTHRVELDYELS